MNTRSQEYAYIDKLQRSANIQNEGLVREKIDQYKGRAHVMFDQSLFPLPELDFLELECDK